MHFIMGMSAHKTVYLLVQVWKRYEIYQGSGFRG